MLPKQHRLRAEKDIKKVFKKGRRMITPLLRFQIYKTGSEETRFAIVVSTKVAKRATIRNLLKRRVREILREHITQVPVGYDIVLQFRSDSVTYATEKIKGQKTPHEIAASYEDIEENIEEFIQKLHSFKNFKNRS